LPNKSELSVEEITTRLEDAVAVNRPRRSLRQFDSIREDLRLDSLALLEVLSRLEDEVDIDLIDNPEVHSVITVGDLVRLIQSIMDESDA
jgi:acyl carrier protein